MTFSITILCYHAECRYPERHIIFIVMLNVIILSVVVVSVMAPFCLHLKGARHPFMFVVR